MQEADYREIKGKIVSGVFALTSRTVVLQVVSFFSTFILTILLSPSIFGVFFVVSAVISFLSYFSDIGFAAALVQKKEEPTRAEYVTSFTIQQILVGSIVIISIFLSPVFSSFYNLGSDGLLLLRALLASFFLSSLKTIPSIILERKLDFQLLIIPQILETVVFYLLAIILALLGWGITSFAWAAVARGIVGLVAIYMISPWKVGIGISFTALRHLLAFGIPFQTNSILALVKDDLMTIFLGKILPFSQVGYIGWAKKWAEAPLRLIMDSIVRVTFPAYSRLQSDSKVLGRAIEKSFFFLAFFIFPVTALMIIFIKPLIQIIPKYTKWEPALISFYLFSFAVIFAAFSSPIVNALNATGRIKTTLVLMVVWTILTWMLVPALTVTFGYNGVAEGAFIISFTGVLPIIIMKKIVNFRIIHVLYKPLVATLFTSVAVFFVLQFANNLPGVIIAAVSAAVIYGLFAWIWMKTDILPYLPKFRSR